MNHVMICSFVPRSGAMTSVCGPTNGIISCIYRRDRVSSSRFDKLEGSTLIPPLTPPYGNPTRAHFQLIQIASAATSPRSTVGPNWCPLL